jgi:hydroxypyruvate isomerase
MRYSYNANGLRLLPLDQAITRVAEAGYDGIELSLHPSHLLPGRDAGEAARRIRRQIAASGLEASSLATGGDLLLGPERFEPSLISAEPEGRERRLRFLFAAIDLAREIGVPVMSFASGIRKEAVPAAEAGDHLRRGVDALVERCGDGLVLALEPEPGFLVETNAQASALLAEVDSPRLRLNQDVGHSKVTDDDYLDAIRQALPWTRHIHVEDIQGRVHRHEIPGDGDLDFPALFALLERGGYRHHLSVELYNHADRWPEALRRSRSHLEAARRQALESVAVS